MRADLSGVYALINEYNSLRQCLDTYRSSLMIKEMLKGYMVD